MSLHEDNRPHLRKSWEGQRKILLITIPEGVFVIPHDTLLAWVRANKTALDSESWLGSLGEYHWPTAPADMVEFLRPYEVR